MKMTLERVYLFPLGLAFIHSIIISVTGKKEEIEREWEGEGMMRDCILIEASQVANYKIAFHVPEN